MTETSTEPSGAIVVWGRMNSLNVQKVLWCLADLGLEFRHEPAGGSDGRLNSDDFARLNPNRLVPVVEDGSVVLWESNAIVRYLCNAYGPPAFRNQTVGQHARQELWMDWYGTELGSHMTKLWGHHKRGKLIAEPELSAHYDRAGELWSYLSDELKGKPFLGGAVPGPGDYALGPAVYRWLAVAKTEQAQLQSYFQSLASRPAFNTYVVKAPI